MTIDPKTLKANWNFPTSIRFGPGRIAELPQACGAAGIARPLLVTDPGLAGLPMIRQAVERLQAEGLPASVFSDVQGNPVGANVEEAQSAESKPDFIHKYGIAQKEARESRYWLRVMLRSNPLSEQRIRPLLDEAGEIYAVITAILKSSKSR